MKTITLNNRSRLYFFAIALLTLLLSACGGGGGGSSSSSTYNFNSSSNVLVSWTASHESAVNTTGGGYIVYYSQTAGFSPGGSGVQSVNVPYVSGTLAPTSTTINLAGGTWYFQVEAYSALNPPGGSSGSQSSPSAEISVKVPGGPLFSASR
ncbi:MAG: hypothetical protein P8Y64_09405 [Gammaproteobacteria bacterium]|jgi:hypothetical protein